MSLSNVYRRLNSRSYSKRSILANGVVLSASFGLIVASVKLLQTRVNTIVSRDAVINGALLDIKAVEDGIISSALTTTGASISQNEYIFEIENQRVSGLTIQEIKTVLYEQQAELRRANAQLAEHLRLRESLLNDYRIQAQLASLDANAQIDEANAELLAVQAEYDLAQQTYERMEYLANEGAISATELDTAQATRNQAEAAVNQLVARVQSMATRRDAVQRNLFLTRGRSDSDPDIRLQETELAIADQRQLIQALEETIIGVEAELIAAERDAELQQNIPVKAPTNGVVWRTMGREGQYVEAGDPLMQMLDCNQRWVDVLVDERSMRRIQPGTRATLKLHGTKDRVFHGEVSTIRSGIGRLAAGEDVAIPLRSNLPRQTQVRVELEAPTNVNSADNFCYVGYTGRVEFEI